MFVFLENVTLERGTRWRSWLRHCARSRKFAGSIPGGIIEIFHWHNPSCRTMALKSTQPLKEMSKEGKCGRCVGLTTLLLSCADCLEIWEPRPRGTLRACPGLWWDCFYDLCITFCKFRWSNRCAGLILSGFFLISFRCFHSLIACYIALQLKPIFTYYKSTVKFNGYES